MEKEAVGYDIFIDNIKADINRDISALFMASRGMNLIQASAVLDAYMENIFFKFDKVVQGDSALLKLSSNEEHKLLKNYLCMWRKNFYVEDIIEKYGLDDYQDLLRIYGLVLGDGIWTDNMEKLLNTGQIARKEVICYREDVYEYLTELEMDEDRALFYSERIRKGIGRRLSETEVAELKNYKVPLWYIDACKKIRYLPSRIIGEKFCWITWRLLYINYMDLHNYRVENK